jgi:hypothetical protein
LVEKKLFRFVCLSFYFPVLVNTGKLRKGPTQELLTGGATSSVAGVSTAAAAAAEEASAASAAARWRLRSACAILMACLRARLAGLQPEADSTGM